MRDTKILGILFILSSLLNGAALHAQTTELVMSAPPREGSRMQSKAFYEPMAKAIGDALGVPVVFKNEPDFFNYGLAMRKGEYDIIFDGPHFGSWRINQIDHEPIVSLPGSLKFVVVTRKDRTDITDKNSLRNKRICGPAVPNLATLTATSQFRDNMIQHPTFVVAMGGMKGTFKAFKAGRCDAAVLRDKFFLKKVKPEERTKYRIVFETKPVVNQSITAGPRLTDEQKSRLRDFLTSPAGSKAADKLLARFSKNNKVFLPADPEKFKGLDKLLIEIAWGWDGK